METIAFKDLYGLDFHITQLFAVNQEWIDGKEFSCIDKKRRTSALLYLKDCDISYRTAAGSRTTFSKGSLIYIPQGSQYISRFSACSDVCAYTQLIEFELIGKDGEPFACSEEIVLVATDGDKYYSELFDDATRTCEMMVMSQPQLKSILYALLARIAKQYQQKDIYSDAYWSIGPAVDYLMKNPYSDISVTELAQLCHMSDSYFRLLFKKYSGKTPSDYCLDNRLAKAKKLLQNSMYSVGEIARLLGYDDPGYFAKVFKKKTGYSPREYIAKK